MDDLHKKRFVELSRAYRTALWCGASPLLIGCTIFLLWIPTRWEGWIVAGLFTLYGGVACFAVGSMALVRYFCIAHRPTEARPPRFWKSVVTCALLLLGNFPVAAGIIASVVAIDSCYSVVVHNQSRQPLEQVRVTGGGCKVDFGTIPPGGVKRRRFWIQCAGRLELRAKCGTDSHAQIIDGYVTGSMGGHTEVTFHADHSISVVSDQAR